MAKTETQTDRYNRFGRPREWLAATTVGITAGCVTFWQLIRSKFYNDSKFRVGSNTVVELKDRNLDIAGTEQIEAAIKTIYDQHMGNEPTYKALVDTRGHYVDMLKRNKGQRWHGEVKGASDKYSEAHAAWHEACGEKIAKARKTPDFIKLTDSYIENVRGIKRTGALHITNYDLDFFGLENGIKGVFQRFRMSSPPTRFSILWKTAAAVGTGFAVTMMAFNQLNNRDKLNELDKQAEVTDRKLDALLHNSNIPVTNKEVDGTPLPARRRGKEILPHIGTHAKAVLADRADAELAADLGRGA